MKKETTTTEAALIKEFYFSKLNKPSFEKFYENLLEEYDFNETKALDFTLNKIKDSKTIKILIDFIKEFSPKEEDFNYYLSLFNISLYTKLYLLLFEGDESFVSEIEEEEDRTFYYIKDENDEQHCFEIDEEGIFTYNDEDQKDYIDFENPYFCYYGWDIQHKRRFLEYWYNYLSLLEEDSSIEEKYEYFIQFIKNHKKFALSFFNYDNSNADNYNADNDFFNPNIIRFIDYNFYKYILDNREYGVDEDYVVNDEVYEYALYHQDLTSSSFSYKEKEYIYMNNKLLNRKNKIELI